MTDGTGKAITAEVVTTVSVGIEVRKNDLRPWTDKWSMVLYCRDWLRLAYDDKFPGLDNRELEVHAVAFFLECDNLRDWLRQDPALGLSVTKQAFCTEWRKHPALDKCYDIANTTKHRIREPGRGSTSQVRGTTVGQTGPTVFIDLDWDTPGTVPVDALDLAEKCVKECGDVFTDLKITPP